MERAEGGNWRKWNPSAAAVRHSLLPNGGCCCCLAGRNPLGEKSPPKEKAMVRSGGE